MWKMLSPFFFLLLSVVHVIKILFNVDIFVNSLDIDFFGIIDKPDDLIQGGITSDCKCEAFFFLKRKLRKSFEICTSVLFESGYLPMSYF